MCLIKFHFTISFVNIMIFPYYNSYLGQSKTNQKKLWVKVIHGPNRGRKKPPQEPRGTLCQTGFITNANFCM